MRRWMALLALTGLIVTGCKQTAGPPPVLSVTDTAQPPDQDLEPINNWAKLPPMRPEAIETAGFGPRFDVTPDGQGVAYCADEGIRISSNGGVTWKTVSTRPIVGPSHAMGYVPFTGSDPEQPACSGVLVDPDHPNSLYVTFSAGSKQYGAPPVFRLGFYTTDGGESWQIAPAPNGVPPDTFAGFRRQGARVKAVFDTTKIPSGNLRVQVTSDGGATWGPGSLNCLTDEICLTFGPLPVQTGSCAMHEYRQSLLVSADSGGTWIESSLSGGVNACFPAELVATGPLQAFLVPQWGWSSVTQTLDGGKTWTPISLPPLPAGTSRPMYLGLQLLPDGSLIQLNNGSQSYTWQLLKPGVDRWCALPTGLIPDDASELHIGGDRLWWLKLNGASMGTTAGQIELASLRCEN